MNANSPAPLTLSSTGPGPALPAPGKDIGSKLSASEAQRGGTGKNGQDESDFSKEINGLKKGSKESEAPRETEPKARGATAEDAEQSAPDASAQSDNADGDTAAAAQTGEVGEAAAADSDGSDLPANGNLLPVVEDLAEQPVVVADAATVAADLTDEDAAVAAVAAAIPAASRSEGARETVTNNTLLDSRAPGTQTLRLSLDAQATGYGGQDGGQQAPTGEQASRALRELISQAITSTQRAAAMSEGLLQTASSSINALATDFSSTLSELNQLTQQRPLQPLGQPETFARGLTERLNVMLNGNLQTARITLQPEVLGPLEVRIQIEEDSAKVWFNAQHSQTREALEQALPRLKELLSEQGLQLAGSDVSGGQSDANEATAAGDTAPEADPSSETGAQPAGNIVASLAIDSDRLLDVTA